MPKGGAPSPHSGIEWSAPIGRLALDSQRQRVRRQLEKCCGLDTEGTVWIVDALGKLVD